MIPGDYLIAIVMVILGVILGLALYEAQEQQRKTNKIRREWKKMKQKELDHE
jgi:hypothetical protein